MPNVRTRPPCRRLATETLRTDQTMTLMRTPLLVTVFAVMLAGCTPVVVYTSGSAAAPKADKASETAVACSYHAQDAQNKQNGQLKMEENEPANQEENGPPKQKVTLPMAIALCVNNNFRVLAAAQGIHIAEADFVTSSLIPNPSLFADCQLIPLQATDVHNQLGPPEWDTLVAIPIDWLMFGKRVAAMEAARWGIDVSKADYEDALRLQLSHTVDAFYEVLMDDAYFKLAEKNVADLKEVEKLTEELAKNNKVGS